jgi:serine/threonine-protein kinase
VLDVVLPASGTACIVMEYLRGQDLQKLLATRGRLPVVEAVSYLLQACEGLTAVHALGIVHRDLKPANLFLTEEGGKVILKVLDFGISKFTGDDLTTTNLTKTSAFVGSPQYISPEQLHTPREVDARTDVWALGVILFELLTGEAPDTQLQYALKLMRGEIPEPPKRPADPPSATDTPAADATKK